MDKESKLRPFYLARILFEQTDEDHYLTTAQLMEKLEKDYSRLSILEASDEDIIQNALMEYGNQFRANYDSEVANKITDVRNRYLDRKDKE